jgi:hypothetical protein
MFTKVTKIAGLFCCFAFTCSTTFAFNTVNRADCRIEIDGRAINYTEKVNVNSTSQGWNYQGNLSKIYLQVCPADLPPLEWSLLLCDSCEVSPHGQQIVTGSRRGLKATCS